ncbi:MAG: SMC family ATPase [Lachnospiraceae bacterium]|nr:SMC family ATPase [Lachnospiraceae bacterium]
MKPEKLIICGWGPYKEETKIDFEGFAERKLFLITGQTGAGKTTIFDAITYALYGTLSGEIREKGSVRSDFADENTKTYVELQMTHRGERYKICRNPEYLRPKKRKSGANEFTKEKETASLTMPDGTIIAGNLDVTAKVEEILAMDAEQFKRISMIAQGEFSKMILANPAEKTAIFREIFATGFYASIQSSLKQHADAIYREYMICQNKMEEDVHMLTVPGEEWEKISTAQHIDFQKAEQFLADRCKLEKEEIKKEQKEEKKLQEELLSLQEKKTLATQVNAEFERYENVCGKLKELEDRKEETELLKKQLKEARNADILSFEEKGILEKEREQENRIQKQQRTSEEIESLKEKIKELSQLYENRQKMEEGYRIKELLTQLKQNGRDASEKTTLAQKELLKVQEEYERVQDDSDRKRMAYERADSAYRKAVVGIAAKLVKEGEPCPVCGSLSHPHIAHISEEIPDEKQLEQLKRDFEESRENCSRLFERALHCKEDVSAKQEQEKESKMQYEKAKEGFDTLPEFVKEYLDKGIAKETFAEKMTAFGEYGILQKEKEKALQELKAEEKTAKEELEKHRESFKKTMHKMGFATVEAYRKALCKPETLEKTEKSIQTYGEELASARSMKEHLETSLKGKSRIDEAPLLQAITRNREKSREVANRIKESSLLTEQIKKSLAGIREKLKKAEEWKKQYGIWKDLDNLASGNNEKRLVFEQYVLAGYFERILKAANLRLYTMTDGRYELKRALKITDGRKKDNLEITVMDFYTGKERSVKTLSGGELFKASLSLALGMSDCIQAENGGITVETLFIDEGFGALDEESLDQACNTLQTLAKDSRLVGIISHVPELRERIENKIIVEKKNEGSYIRQIYEK